MRAISLETVTRADDPALAALSELLERTLADTDTLLGLDRLREFVAESNADREFCVLVATSAESVIGGAVFSYVGASNCGFSEYIVAAPEARGTGLGRRIFDARKAMLDAAAQRAGPAACRGLFIEVDSPQRTPADLLAAERETAMDAWERLRLFDHLGFRRVSLHYVQPPLAPGKQAVDYLDLLFAPWLSAHDAIPSETVLLTVEPVWRAWSPTGYAVPLATLRAELADRSIALEPLAGIARGG